MILILENVQFYSAAKLSCNYKYGFYYLWLKIIWNWLNGALRTKAKKSGGMAENILGVKIAAVFPLCFQWFTQIIIYCAHTYNSVVYNRTQKWLKNLWCWKIYDTKMVLQLRSLDSPCIFQRHYNNLFDSFVYITQHCASIRPTLMKMRKWASTKCSPKNYTAKYFNR